MSVKRSISYSETCPHCGVPVDLYQRWSSSGDYSSEFDMDCPSCEKRFGVTVESVPVFSVCKVTNEQREKEAWERARAREAARKS